MPASDANHQIVVRCLIKAGWTIVKEQYSLVLGTSAEDIRRLYIDIAARSSNQQLAFIEVKALEHSPMHQFMMLVGQYIVYRSALNYLADATPLYVAISQNDYELIVSHPLTQQVLLDTLTEPIPFVVYDPIREEILRWIPAQ